MKRINFEGEIWAIKNKKPTQELLSFLTSKDCLLVLRTGEPPYKVTLGVPHQAAIREEYICEKEGKRVSDENTASYALVSFTTLRDQGMPCKLVIMAHSTTTDPNKDLKNPYCQEIFRNPTCLIIECHGANQSRILDLELSAGNNKLAKTLNFGRLLVSELEHRYTVGVQEQAGKKNAIIFYPTGKEKEGKLKTPAISTASLKEAEKKQISALHLEAKPLFRKPIDLKNIVTSDGLILGKALGYAIIKFFDK